MNWAAPPSIPRVNSTPAVAVSGTRPSLRRQQSDSHLASQRTASGRPGGNDGTALNEAGATGAAAAAAAGNERTTDHEPRRRGRTLRAGPGYPRNRWRRDSSRTTSDESLDDRSRRARRVRAAELSFQDRARAGWVEAAVEGGARRRRESGGRRPGHALRQGRGGRLTDADALLYIVQHCQAQETWQGAMQALEEQTQRVLLPGACVRFFVLEGGSLMRSGQLLSAEVGISGNVCRSRKYVNLSNPKLHALYNPRTDSFNGRDDGAALLVMPLEADSSSHGKGPLELIGILQAFRGSACFSEKEVHALRRLRCLAGTLIKKARLCDLARSRCAASASAQARSDALLDVNLALASRRQLQELIAIIVKKVPQLLDCDRCSLFIVDHETEELVVKQCASEGKTGASSSGLPFEGKDELRLSIHEGLAGFVALSGETVNVAEARLDHRFNWRVDRKTGYYTRSLLCLPLLENSVVIGVLQAVNKNSLYPGFNSADEQLLKAFSSQAAIAVRNSLLLERTQAALARSDALLAVARAISQTNELDAVVRVIVEKVQGLLDCERCTLFIVDKGELYTSPVMSYGLDHPLPIDATRERHVRFSLGEGIVGTVAETGDTINLVDAYTDPRFDPRMDLETGFRTKSMVCMAIKDHEAGILGVIEVINARRGKFGPADESLLVAFCAQAAVAIYNTQLYLGTQEALNTARAERRHWKFLLSVVKNLFSSMHMSEMLHQLTMQSHELLKADACALFLRDDRDGSSLVLINQGDSPGPRFAAGTGIAGLVMSTGEPVRIPKDAFQDARFSASVDQRDEKVTHSIVCCPIKGEGNDDGILGVLSARIETSGGHFDVAEQKLLEVFCTQAALWIQNSKRFTEIMVEVEEDHEKGEEASPLKMFPSQKRQRRHSTTSGSIIGRIVSPNDLELLQPIGSGTYGNVHLAKLRGQAGRVAVKKLHVKRLAAEQLAAFCAEAALMCQLDHPNVVRFMGAITQPNNLCIITQFCERGSLWGLLHTEDVQMSYCRKVEFALDAARGMAYLHQSIPPIMHRDLKSDNLLVGQDWRVRVADFGLTRFISDKAMDEPVGTPMCMAPELIQAEPYTEMADVYAFGVVLWEILTEKEPYEGLQPLQIIVGVVNDNLRPDLPTVLEGETEDPLVTLMKHCWDKHAKVRPTFEVIVERLSRLYESLQDNPTPLEEAA